MTCNFRGFYNVAIVGQDERYCRAAKLLVTSLGLPQVCVLEAGDSVPSNIHTLVAFGPTGWAPNKFDRSVWRLSGEGSALKGDVQLASSGLGGTPRFKLFPERKTVFGAPINSPEVGRLINAATLTTYYSFKRGQKLKSLRNSKEQTEWQLFQILMNRKAPRDPAHFLSTVARAWDTMPDIDTPQNGKKGRAQRSINPHSINIKNILKPFFRFDFRSAKKGLHVNSEDGFSKKTFFSNPLNYLDLAIRAEIPDKHFDCDQLKSLVSDCRKTVDLACLGLILYLLGDQDGTELVLNNLLSDELYDNEAGCIRSSIGAASYCYSPILSIFLLLKIWNEDRSFLPKLSKESTHDFEWAVFPNSDSMSNLLRILGEGKDGSFISFSDKTLSSSLLENWLESITVPLLDNCQYELLAPAYTPLSYYLEQYWLAFFLQIQLQAEDKLIRVKPWPIGYKAAFSLRYDVDRDTSKEKIDEILSIQSSYFNARCGSWYFIPGSHWEGRVSSEVESQAQEVGVHATREGQSVANRGVTYHSAPSSVYWRGRSSVLDLESGEAKYAEHLAVQLVTPRPGWIVDGKVERETKLWLLPLHFPLEGSTNDKTLEYFDRHISRFRELLTIGGHVIVGSHPDLNQKILEELIERESLQGLWYAPVAEVVERCQNVMDYGNLSILVDRDGQINLSAKHDIPGLQLEIYSDIDSFVTVSADVTSGEEVVIPLQ